MLSDRNLMITILFTLFHLSIIFGQCLQEGKTWSTEGELVGISGIPTLTECIKLCLQHENCEAFTWYGELHPLNNLCILFHSTIDEYECAHCQGGLIKDIESCACNKQNTACFSSPENLLNVTFSTSENDCVLKCISLDGCSDYTWFDDKNEELHNTCFLLSSCDSTEVCDSGCFSGSLNCNNDPCSDMMYGILDDVERNIDNNHYNAYCDDVEDFSPSPNWNGTGWYRFKNPAGTNMPVRPPGKYSCGTLAPIWFDGIFPGKPGDVTESTACAQWENDVCYRIFDIKIMNCNEYNLYFLPDTDWCNSRYCAE